MKYFSSLIAFLFLLILAAASEAVVYQYFDEEGTLIITDNPYGVRKPRQPVDRARHPNLTFRDDVSYEYYPVQGANLSDVMADIRNQGMLRSEHGTPFAAETRWNIGWSYDYQSSFAVEADRIVATVHITNVRFDSRITVMLPNLSAGPVFSEIENEHWERFLGDLLEHEHDHVRIILYPRYRDEALARMNTVRTLTLPHREGINIDAEISRVVEDETAEIGHAMIRTIREKNDEYDRLTDHGLKHYLRQTFFIREGIVPD